jgi:hypothetical protein
MAAVATAALVDRIEGTGDGERLGARLDPSLVVRTTTAAPPAG